MTTPRITFTVPKPIHEKLTELALLTDTSTSGLVNRAVREWLEQNYESHLAFYCSRPPR